MLADGGALWRRWTVCVVAAAAAFALSLFSAAPASAATTLRVSAGFAGTYAPGATLPVRIVVTADRLVAGVLEVTLGDGPPTLASVEVPGGSEKEFLVLLPTDRAPRSRDVSVRLPDGSRSPPSARTSVQPANDQELVGLLPGALAGRPVPGRAPLAVDVGTAQFVPLGPVELDRAPDSVAPLGTIAVGHEELGSMAAGIRQGLLAWLEGGGRLLVDGEPGTRIAGLPDHWQPVGSTRMTAGRGEVRLTGDAIANGRWGGLVEPTGRGNAGGGQWMGGPPIGDSLARAAGFRLPRISWLVGFLVLYVAVVGPGLFIVLRRRRRSELAWVAIPLIALLFTGASYAAGRTLRQATEMVHGTVVTTGASGARATSYLGVVSRRGGTVRIGFPAGWIAGAGEDRGAEGTALERITIGARGPEARLPLDSGQFGLVSGAGPIPLKGALEVTATSDGDGRARGTVRNGTSLPLQGGAVFVGSSWASIGPLGPGEEREWRGEGARGGFEGGPPPEAQLWMPRGPGRFGVDQHMQFSLWDLAQRVGGVSRETGRAVALGWTSEFDPPVRVAGGAVRPRGHTLVLGEAPVRAAALTTDLSVRREVVRGAGAWERPIGPGRFQTVVRMSLPPERRVDPARLFLRTPGMPVEVWTGESWKALECSGSSCAQPQVRGVPRCPPGASCDDVVVRGGPGSFSLPPGAGPSGDVDLPPGAIREGVLYLRLASSLPPESVFSLRERA